MPRASTRRFPSDWLVVRHLRPDRCSWLKRLRGLPPHDTGRPTSMRASSSGQSLRGAMASRRSRRPPRPADAVSDAPDRRVRRRRTRTAASPTRCRAMRSTTARRGTSAARSRRHRAVEGVHGLRWRGGPSSSPSWRRRWELISRSWWPGSSDMAAVAGYRRRASRTAAHIVPAGHGPRRGDRLDQLAGLRRCWRRSTHRIGDHSSSSGTGRARVEVTTLRWQDPNATTEPDPAMPFSVPRSVVEWAVTGRPGPARRRRPIRRARPRAWTPQDRLPRLRPATRTRSADLGGSTNAGVTWVDLRGLRLAASRRPLGDDRRPSATPEMNETEIAPWLEPLDRSQRRVVRSTVTSWSSDAVLLVE